MDATNEKAVVEGLMIELHKVRAPDILQEGISAMANRALIRDQPNGERSAGRAAEIVSAWEGREITESTVWRVLIAVKMARSMQGSLNLDDYIDLASYASLLGECEVKLNSD